MGSRGWGWGVAWGERKTEIEKKELRPRERESTLVKVKEKVDSKRKASH